MASTPWSDIHADLRALLTALSLDTPPRPLPPEMDGRATFGTDAWIIPGIVEWGVMRGAGIAHVQREVTLKRGLDISATLSPDTAYIAAVTAQDAIIRAFLAEQNQPTGVYNIELIDGAAPDQTSESHWILAIRVRVEYTIDVP